jgi:mannose-6-phosphate isomerase-like protein (cupin superfamily)
MIAKFRIDAANGEPEFGMVCQRLVPWTGAGEDPPLGVMACFLPRRSESAPDCHDQDEFMIVLTGEGDIEIAGEHEPVAAGEAILIPRNRRHIVRNTADTHLTWVSVYWPLHEPSTGAGS